MELTDVQWTPEIVEDTLIGSARIISATVGRIGPSGMKSNMPAVAHDWEDIQDWLELAEPAQPTRLVKTQRRIMIAEYTLMWPATYVSREDHRCVLCSYIGAKAARRSFGKVIRRKGWVQRTAYARRDSALVAISAGLTKAGVPVITEFCNEE